MTLLSPSEPINCRVRVLASQLVVTGSAHVATSPNLLFGEGSSDVHAGDILDGIGSVACPRMTVVGTSPGAVSVNVDFNVGLPDGAVALMPDDTDIRTVHRNEVGSQRMAREGLPLVAC